MIQVKKLTALLLALVLVLSLSVTAFAYNPPTSSTTVSTPSWLSSVTVDGTTAYYQTDNNTVNTIYIRAKLPVATKTEYDLQTATVVVTTTGGVPILMDGATTIPYDSAVGNAYTWNSLNLFNKSYSLGPSGGRTNYLAAGLETGQVGIHANDPVRIESTSTLDNNPVNVYGSNVQNPFMGNLYFVETSAKWTFINYFFVGTLEENTPLDNIPGVIDRDYANATVSGGGYTNSTATSFNFDFSGTTKSAIKITNGSLSRTYRLMLVIEGQDIVIQQIGSERNYDFNFDELKASAYYTGIVKTKADAIEAAWSAYIATSHIFSSGTTVMDVLEDFIDWAETTDKPGTTDPYFAYASDTGGGSYLAVLNGLSYADCGTLAGWMYTDDEDGYFWTSTTDHSNIPVVGAGDYILDADDVIVWFYTVNYNNWF